MAESGERPGAKGGEAVLRETKQAQKQGPRNAFRSEQRGASKLLGEKRDHQSAGLPLLGGIRCFCWGMNMGQPIRKGQERNSNRSS